MRKSLYSDTPIKTCPQEILSFHHPLLHWLVCTVGSQLLHETTDGGGGCEDSLHCQHVLLHQAESQRQQGSETMDEECEEHLRFFKTVSTRVTHLRILTLHTCVLV